MHDEIDLTDFFCGAGGSSQGAAAVPGVQVRLAANHWDVAIASHQSNFPDTEHVCGDIHDEDLVDKIPGTALFWASPECTFWSQARGEKQDFARQPDLFEETLPDAAADRSRALMWDVPKYLAKMKLRGAPVLAGVVENVVEERKWVRWHEWVRSIQLLGYKTRLIALNSMHAQAVNTLGAPQSRDRLYLAYWLESLGRDPDWNKWLRPRARCEACDEEVRAVQVFKNPRNDMGKYRQQYLYRCPHAACRNAVVEPTVLPAAVAIDWADLGAPIGDRQPALKPKTLARIKAGIEKYARPITVEVVGNTFERQPGVRTWPADAPLTAQTATMTKALACPPLVVPAGGTWRDEAASAESPFAARTTRENDGLAFPPLVVVMRNGEPARPAGEPVTAITTSGGHHALAVPPEAASMIMRNNGSRNGGGGEHCTPADEPVRTLTSAGHQSLVAWPHLLVPYYTNGIAQPVTDPVGALSTRDRYALATDPDVIDLAGYPMFHPSEIDLMRVLFRMLKPAEIARAMAFGHGYTVIGTQRERIRQYGNAVTPPASEVLISALVEAITGADIPLAA